MPMSVNGVGTVVSVPVVVSMSPMCHSPDCVKVQIMRSSDTKPYVLNPKTHAGLPNSASIAQTGSTLPKSALLR